MPIEPWLQCLDDDDRQFLKRFVLASGSLKELAEGYGVSYPTLRARLDRLIEKVKVAEDERIVDPFERKLRLLVSDGKIGAPTARELLTIHRTQLKERK